MSNYGTYLQIKSLKEGVAKHFLCLTGGKMCGNIDMNCNKIINLDNITFCNGNIFNGNVEITDEHLDYISSEISDNFITTDNSNQLINDLDFGCNHIVDVSGIYFCDGTYIGHGNSFDISTNETLKIYSVSNVFNSNTIFNNNVDITGNLRVTGDTTTVGTTNSSIKDNIITINQPIDENGDPVNDPLMDRNNFESGFVVYRGPDDSDVFREPYVILYDNSTQTLKIGISGEELPVARRENNPLNNGIAIWNSTDNKFDTIYLLDPSGNLDLSCNLIQDVSGIYFCDGTYIGSGNSFDISTNVNLDITTNEKITMDSSEVVIDGRQNNPSGNATLTLHSNDGDDCLVHMDENNVTRWTLRNQGGNGDRFFIQGEGGVTDKWFTLEQTSGNCGIGSTNPTEKLDVNGNTIIRGSLDMDCNLINDVSGINFCDGTYIGTGNSFEVIGDSSDNVFHIKNQKTFGEIGPVYGSYPISKFTVNQTPEDLDRGLEIGAPSGGVIAPVYLKVTGTSNDFRILDANDNNNLTIKSSGTAGGEPYFGFSETEPARKYVFATNRPSGQSSTLMALYNKNYDNADTVLSFRSDISGSSTFTETAAIGMNTVDFDISNATHGTNLRLFNYVNDSLYMMVELNNNNYLNVFSDICMNCNLINDVSGINFCDGTYIGTGNSFDISTNEEFKIIQNGTEHMNLDLSGNLYVKQNPVLLERTSVFSDTISYSIGSNTTETVRFRKTVCNQMNLRISGTNSEIISPSIDISRQLVEIYMNVEFTGGNNGDIQFDISSVSGTSFLEEIDNRTTRTSGTYYLTFGPHIFIPSEWSGSTSFNFLLTNRGNQAITINKSKIVLKSRVY
jgi:hypothetical protein